MNLSILVLFNIASNSHFCEQCPRSWQNSISATLCATLTSNRFVCSSLLLVLHKRQTVQFHLTKIMLREYVLISPSIYFFNLNVQHNDKSCYFLISTVVCGSSNIDSGTVHLFLYKISLCDWPKSCVFINQYETAQTKQDLSLLSLGNGCEHRILLIMHRYSTT